MYKPILLSLTIVLFYSQPIFSQWSILESPQTTRSNDARGTALGLTGASYHEGLFSISSNPAGLSFLKRVSVGYSHSPSSFSNGLFNQDAFGIAFPVFGKVFLSFNYLGIDFGEQGYYDEHGDLQEENSALRIASISTSGLITKGKSKFSLGVSAKYFDDRIQDFKANVFWFDVGARYKRELENNKNFALGLSLTSFGNDLKDENDYVVTKPMKLLRIGMSFQSAEFRNTNLSVLGTIEYQRGDQKIDFVGPDDRMQDVRWNHIGTGMEFRFIDHMFGRIGYFFDLENEEYKTKGITYGIGFTMPEKISSKIPIYLSLTYGRSIRAFRNFVELDQNILNFEASFDY